MSIADTFKQFLSNIAVDNDDTISLRYGEVTAALNKKFRDTDSKFSNSLQVGSYGRWTAIKGISDLDMLYIMPAGKWDSYKEGGQSRLLDDTKNAIKSRYPSTTVLKDRLVVQVLYRDFHIEVQPVFEQADGSFKYPDTYDGGSWKITKPREEIAAMKESNVQKNKNLRRLCKMARAWKNKHGLAMGGLLIDTLTYNFLKSSNEYDEKSYLYYDYMSRDFFKFLSERPDQDYYAALGSGQRVKVKKKFQKKAKKAYELALDAIAAAGSTTENEKWRKIYGRGFPAAEQAAQKAAFASSSWRNTEEFIDNRYPVDIRSSITLDCEVSQNGFRERFLREMLRLNLPLKTAKTLTFSVVDHDIQGDFNLYWKVLNRGEEARRRDCIRGQIDGDRGSMRRTEHTNFRGDHIVECYAVQNGVVVATDRIHVPIQGSQVNADAA
ncbi:SMODS domain-containing nucleotidyltransferase [Rhizobium herbae]